MRFLSSLSVLALLAALAICHPHLRIPERNLRSSDLDSIADLLKRDVESTSARTEGGHSQSQAPPRQSQPRSQSAPRQTEPARQTQRSSERPQTHSDPPRQTSYSQPRETRTQPAHSEPRSSSYSQPRETRTEPAHSEPRSSSYSQPRETRTEPAHSEPHSSSYSQPRETFTPPSQTWSETRTPRQSYTPPYHTTYTSVYNPPPYSEPHQTHHRSENGYTTIFISVGNPTTYYQPIYVQPTYYISPPTITVPPVPVTYTTVYVYPDTDSDSQTYYSTITTYVLPSQQTSTTYIYQTYVAPPASTATAQRPGAEPTPGVNPWAGSCPIPSQFVVNNFVSDSGGVSLSISYNGGTFKCPNTPNNEVIYNGMNDMYCDDDGLVRVITDGSSWLWISEWSWCNAVPATAGNMPTLEASTNYTNFGYYALDCTTGATGKQTCKQAVQDFTIPVASYGLGGAIGFEPLDINGNYLPGCPSATNVQPIVTNTATCASVQAQSTGLTTVTIIS